MYQVHLLTFGVMNLIGMNKQPTYTESISICYPLDRFQETKPMNP